jgi:hypothetical protein
MGRLPKLDIVQAEVKELGPDVYQVIAHFRNPGWFPTSAAQGRRALTAWAIRVEFKSTPEMTLFSGRPVESIPFLEGSGGTQKLEWTVKGKKGSSLTIRAASPRLGTTSKTVVLN